MYTLYKIDASDGIDVNKTKASKEGDICQYWYFLNYSFKFQLNVCNWCHDLLKMSLSLSDIVLTFGNVKIKKKKNLLPTPIFLKDVDIKKLLASNKNSFGEKNYKNFVVYLYHNCKVKP